MADFIRFGFPAAELEAHTPLGWELFTVSEAIAQEKVGRKYDNKSVLHVGSVPVLNQQALGFHGYHNDEPGVFASQDNPVVTFANHTCAIRLVDFPFSAIQNVFVLRGRAMCSDTRFLKYWLTGRIETDSYRGHFPDLLNMRLPLPPLPEQRRIAGVLGTLDDLIDTNEQLSGRLQRSMSAHYSRVSQQATHVGPIGEFVKTAARGVTPKYSGDDGAVLVLNQKCIRNGLVNLNSARLMQPRPAKPEKVVQPGDAVVNSTGVGTLGRAARWVGADPIFVDSHVTVVKPADSEESGWVARALVESLADIEALAQGSTGQTELSRGQLLSLSVAVPPKSIRVQASRLFDELDASIEVLATENQQLRQARDELLPLLMSGKIRVREAEELVKERVG